MTDKFFSIQDLFYKPYYQGVLFLALTLIVSLLSFSKKPDPLWIIAGIIYIIFIVTNSFIILKVDRHWNYFFISMLCSIVYLGAAGILIKSIIGIFKIDGPQESSMIFLVVMYHPFLLLLGIFIKWLLLKVF